eukprot:13152772-Alexandrium_andersonii.AAC.1
MPARLEAESSGRSRRSPLLRGPLPYAARLSVSAAPQRKGRSRARRTYLCMGALVPERHSSVPCRPLH